MGKRTLGRREVLMGAGVAAGGVALTGLGAAPAVANDQGSGDPTGSWMATRQDDPPGDPTKVKLVISFAGGDVFLSHDINPAGPPFTGTWARRHGGGFKATFWTGNAGGPNGGAGPTIRVRLRGRLEHNMISGSYDFAVFDPVSDQQIASGTGSLSGTRINA